LSARKSSSPVRFFDRIDQSLDQRTLRTGPLRHLVDHRLAVLMQKFVRRDRRLSSLRHGKMSRKSVSGVSSVTATSSRAALL